jgi:hypothetical protein
MEGMHDQTTVKKQLQYLFEHFLLTEQLYLNNEIFLIRELYV